MALATVIAAKRDTKAPAEAQPAHFFSRIKNEAGLNVILTTQKAIRVMLISDVSNMLTKGL